MTREFPFYLAGEPCRSAHQLEVLNPTTSARPDGPGSPETGVRAGRAAAVAAAEPMRRLPACQRANILRAASAEIESRREEIGDTLAREVPTWRIDHIPYGGVKDSGLGRTAVHD